MEIRGKGSSAHRTGGQTQGDRDRRPGEAERHVQSHPHRQLRPAGQPSIEPEDQRRDQAPRIPAGQRPREGAAPWQPGEIELRREDAGERGPEQEHSERPEHPARRRPAHIEAGGWMTMRWYATDALLSSILRAASSPNVRIAVPLFIASSRRSSFASGAGRPPAIAPGRGHAPSHRVEPGATEIEEEPTDDHLTPPHRPCGHVVRSQCDSCRRGGADRRSAHRPARPPGIRGIQGQARHQSDRGRPGRRMARLTRLSKVRSFATGPSTSSWPACPRRAPGPPPADSSAWRSGSATASSSTSTCVRPTAAPTIRCAATIPRSTASFPDFDFARLRKEAPEKYESYVDLEPGVWTRVRIVVQGTTARLFVHGAAQPALIVQRSEAG